MAEPPVPGVPARVDSFYAPGVTHRESGGLSTRAAIDLVHVAAGYLVAAAMVEYNPRFVTKGMMANVPAQFVPEGAGVVLQAPNC